MPSAEALTDPTFTKDLVRSLVPRRVRNWLRAPSNSARWVWDDLKFYLGSTEIVQMRPGWFLKCHPAVFRCSYFFQVHDPEQIAEFDGFVDHASEGMVLFDIGAHFGLFSIAALHFGGARAQAVAVDPSPIAVRLMKIQARLNDMNERLRIVQASVAAHTGRQRMVAVGVQAHGFYVAPGPEHSAEDVIATEAITLDRLADQMKLTPTHIKIDVEGGEAAVLRGAERLLARRPGPTLFLEMHNEIVSLAGGDPREALKLVRDAGYQTFSVDGKPIADEAILAKPLIRIIAKSV